VGQFSKSQRTCSGVDQDLHCMTVFRSLIDKPQITVAFPVEEFDSRVRTAAGHLPCTQRMSGGHCVPAATGRIVPSIPHTAVPRPRVVSPGGRRGFSLLGLILPGRYGATMSRHRLAVAVPLVCIPAPVALACSMALFLFSLVFSFLGFACLGCP
jgi:hypothetical protein